MNDPATDTTDNQPAAGAPPADNQTPTAGSLLDRVTTLSDGTHGDQDPSVPADGDQPEWFRADKYKTVEDQAKAYTELEKKLGNFQGAPDEYQAVIPEELADYTAEELQGDPRFEAFAKIGKELNLSQDGFAKIIGAYLEADAELSNTNIEREFQALGPEAEQRVTTIANFYGNAFDNEDQLVVREIASTADGVLFLERAMQKMRAASTIPTNVGQPAPESLGGVYDNTDMERYMKDANYRNARLAQARRAGG